jgi:pectate lyase
MVRSNNTITVKGDHNVSVEGGGNVSVKVDSNVDIRGSGTVNVAGSGTLTVSGSTVGINNAGAACRPAARLADTIQGFGGGDAGPVIGSITSGSSSVCIG